MNTQSPQSIGQDLKVPGPVLTSVVKMILKLGQCEKICSTAFGLLHLPGVGIHYYF